MTDAAAEAVNWALERAARLAEEACPCNVGPKLATEIRALKVTHEHVEYATPEELEEMGVLERYAKLRGPVAEANLRALNAVTDNVTLVAPAQWKPQLDEKSKRAAAMLEAVTERSHEHNKSGPMLPVDGIYRPTCTCGHVHVA